VSLPLKPPIEPQLARSRPELPEGEQWAYEPKYDGFRAIVFVDDREVMIQSRGGKALGRYFPELAFGSGRYIIDGEIVIDDPDGGGQDFSALQQRIHPAESRVQRLAAETPARFIAFDLLARNDQSWLEVPFDQRRTELESLVAAPIALTPLTRARGQAEPWLHSAEGVIAKDVNAPYRPGKRTAMVKVKRVRTIDAVVVGYRPGKEPDTVGSLILGLYDTGGELHVVGHSSGLRAGEKRALVDKLEPFQTGNRGRGDPSRWKNEKELEWIELRPELVVEVTFDHTSGGRIRHGTKILRWRTDKQPRACALEQMQA
jgi:ATP-dependent DNA ligase